MNLNELETPQIVEELDYESILENMKADLLKRDPNFTAFLESDPLIKLLEVCAYREFILRHRINEAATANLLAFAEGSDLDYLAEFYGVIRQENETDDDFRNRVQAKIVGWTTAGSKEAYRYHALSSDMRVKDARADSPEAGVVRISILSKENGGEVSDDLLQSVRNYINKEDIRVLTDKVEVVPCNIIKVDVIAKIELMNSTPQEILETIKEKFEEKFKEIAILGNSISKNWITANLFMSGVKNVELISPQNDISVLDTECAYLKNLSLNLVETTYATTT